MLAVGGDGGEGAGEHVGGARGARRAASSVQHARPAMCESAVCECSVHSVRVQHAKVNALRPEKNNR